MSLTFVSEQLLATNKLSHQDLYSVLGQLAERRIDYADLYFQSSYHEAWVIEDGIIKDGSYNIDQASACAPSAARNRFRLCRSDHPECAAAERQAARSIVREQATGGRTGRNRLPGAVPAARSAAKPAARREIALLHRVDKVARAADARVQEVNASITGVYEQVLVAATDGTLAADVRPLVRLSVSVLVEQDGKRERGSSGGGGRFGYDYFLETVDGDVRADAYAKSGAHGAGQSRRGGGAGRQYAGGVGSRLAWVLLHEAVGHGLEGDFNRRGTSVFSGHMGELVASELCTVVDDGTCRAPRLAGDR